MSSKRWIPQEETESLIVDATDADDDDDAFIINNGHLGSHSRMMKSDSEADEEDDNDDDGNGVEGNVDHKLIRTGPMIDPFYVEALEVHSVQRTDYEELPMRKKVVLACQTLGFVFGDIGTSPLYTFSVMFSRSPVQAEDDVLGALSLVIYALILIPLVKYVFFVIWASDEGEGGTFALYSLICRHAKVSLLPNQLHSDVCLSSFRLKIPSVELERSLKLKDLLENSSKLKMLVLIVVLFGTSMVITDGVLTSTMSVLSAVDGLKVEIAGIRQEEVVMISVAVLIILFSVQKLGTSKMGPIVGPAILTWYLSLGIIGFYNLIKYDTTVLRAFNPVHIYYIFKKNSSQAWLSLGGCLLCITGSEVMFADLCYLSVRSIQLTFIFLVLPCLLLGYLGQAAYLVENQAKSGQVFFASIPSGAFWPVFVIAIVAALIASRAMTVAVFTCIKQSTALGCFPRLKIIHTSRKFMGQIYIPVMNWFLLVSCLVFVCTFSSTNEIGIAYGLVEVGAMMATSSLVTIIMVLVWKKHILTVLSFLVFFLGLELIFFFVVLSNARKGSWLALGFALVLFLIMYIWNYGSKLKYETEVKQKLSKDIMRKLGSNLGTTRVPGIGLLYNELAKGVPAVFGQLLTNLPAVHSMIVFVCVKYVSVPVVPQSERCLFRRVCPKSYHIFRCIARYGYKDVHKENHSTFEQLLIESLEKFIRQEAQERSLESDGDRETESEDEISNLGLQVSLNGGSVSKLVVPLLADYQGTDEASTSAAVRRVVTNSGISVVEQSLERELSFLRKARESGIVYLLSHGGIRARKDSWFVKKLVINYFYSFLRKNSRRATANLSVPHSRLMQVNMTYMV